ncbi:MAG: ABC transporter permease subunit [Deltaproteobacteria bacterium]|nr:ABC transporter permease subunit [Deltaproteobacteria bacterium]
MIKIFAIAHNTFREAIRDKILYGFLFFAVCIILFSLVLGQLSLGQQIRTTVDVGLFGISLFSVLISIFIGINLLNKEIQKRTIYPVLSKPVSRPAYLLGKFLGIALVLLVQICLMLLVFFPLVKLQGGHITFGLVTAVVLIYFEVLVIISMALFFTSFSSPFLSGIFCLGLFVAGRNAHLIAELSKQENLKALAPLFDSVSTALPNLYLFYPSGKMVEGAFASVHAQFISNGYLFSTIGYGLAVCFGFLCAAIVILNRRDFL